MIVDNKHLHAVIRLIGGMVQSTSVLGPGHYVVLTPRRQKDAGEYDFRSDVSSRDNCPKTIWLIHRLRKRWQAPWVGPAGA